MEIKTTNSDILGLLGASPKALGDSELDAVEDSIDDFSSILVPIQAPINIPNEALINSIDALFAELQTESSIAAINPDALNSTIESDSTLNSAISNSDPITNDLALNSIDQENLNLSADSLAIDPALEQEILELAKTTIEQVKDSINRKIGRIEISQKGDIEKVLTEVSKVEKLQLLINNIVDKVNNKLPSTTDEAIVANNDLPTVTAEDKSTSIKADTKLNQNISSVELIDTKTNPKIQYNQAIVQERINLQIKETLKKEAKVSIESSPEESLSIINQEPVKTSTKTTTVELNALNKNLNITKIVSSVSSESSESNINNFENFLFQNTNDLKQTNSNIKVLNEPIQLTQLTTTIAEQAKQVAPKGEETIHIKLTPEDLGIVEVNIKRTNNHIEIKMYFSSKESVRIIESRIDDLVQHLNSKGFETKIEVSSSDLQDLANQPDHNQSFNQAREEQKNRILNRTPDWLRNHKSGIESSFEGLFSGIL